MQTLNSCNGSMKIFKKSPISRVIVFLYINTRPYSARMKQKNIGFKLLFRLQPPYSVDLTQNGLHLFSFQQNILFDENFSGENICGKLLEVKIGRILLERNQKATW